VIDTWLLVIIVIVVTVAAIEGIPAGFDKKAEWLVVELTAVIASIFRRVARMVTTAMDQIGQWVRPLRLAPEQSTKPKAPLPAWRVVAATAVAVIASPVAAIPMTFLFTLLLYALNLIGADEYSFATNGSDTLRYIAGYAYVILIATLDLSLRWSAVALPLLIATGFLAARYAARSSRFIRNLALSSLLMGCVYPLVFILAEALDVLDDSIFN
jgi:hypothetical protein